jgi:K+ transporter
MYLKLLLAKPRILTIVNGAGRGFLVFWTLTLQTTLKYVIITLKADNKGEGGIFSLFSLVRRKAKWLIVPAILGGCALLADGIITPPITISSAIEGLEPLVPQHPYGMDSGGHYYGAVYYSAIWFITGG